MSPLRRCSRNYLAVYREACKASLADPAAVAVFDDDGKPWSEQPIAIQFAFAVILSCRTGTIDVEDALIASTRKVVTTEPATCQLLQFA
jgi:hypothetical protein